MFDMGSPTLYTCLVTSPMPSPNKIGADPQVVRLWDEVSKLCGYTAKRTDSPRSRWKFLARALAYIKQHPDLFRF